MSVDNITPDMVPWDDGGPPKRKTYPIFSPRPGELLRGIVLGDKIIGVRTHWIDGRTVPCISPRGQCRGCEQWNRRLWKGYLAWMLLPNKRLGVAEYTKGAVEAMDQGVLNSPCGLRGLYSTLRRPNGKPQGRVVATLSAPPAEWRGLDIPPAFDVKAELWEIWSAPGLPPAADGQADDDGEDIPL